MRLDAGAIKGFKSAEEINSLMSSVEGWSPAWKSGTSVAEVTVNQGTRVRMVVSKDTFKALSDLSGRTDISRSFGGWATFDNVPNQADARNVLAMTEAVKADVGYVVDIEIIRSLNAQVGVVGSQGQALGGGNQLHFFIPPSERTAIFKFISGAALR